MSVIQDALKRKLDEQQREAAQAPPRSPSVVRASPQAPPVAQQVIENDPRSVPILSPTPIRSRPARPAHPAPVSVGSRGDQFTTQLLLGAILFMLVGGFGGAVVYFLQARNQDLRAMSSSAPAPAVVQTPGASAGQMGAGGNLGAGTVVPPSSDSGAAGVATTAGANAPAGQQPVLDPSTAVTATANAGTAPETTPAEVVAAAAGASGSPAPPPVSESGWPLIHVEGVMASATPSRSSALLNDQMIRVRQRVDGVRLVEVRTEGVLLEFKGETRFVETGTTSLEYE